MKRHARSVLHRELRVAGATETELPALLSLAGELSNMHPKDDTAAHNHPVTRLRVAYVSAVFVVAVFLILAIAQVASPNSLLYPAQQFSDNVAMVLRPSYRATVMMKRADQVNELVAVHASNQRTLSVLADYTSVAVSYKAAPHASYADFQYCESKLTQAARTAPPQIKQAIQQSLAALDTT